MTVHEKERFWIEIKIVKVRKDHECGICDVVIAKGTRALVETGKTESEGFYACYFHTDRKCYKDYLEIVQPSKTPLIEEKVKDKAFCGQITYDSWKAEAST